MSIHLLSHKEIPLITSTLKERTVHLMGEVGTSPKTWGKVPVVPAHSHHSFWLLHFYHSTSTSRVWQNKDLLIVVHACAKMYMPHSYSQPREQRTTYMPNTHIPSTYTKKEMLPACEIKIQLAIFISVININGFILFDT